MSSQEIKVEAAVLEKFGSALVVKEISIETPGAGEALISLQTTAIPYHTHLILNGIIPSGLVPPFVPGFGGVGVVRYLGPDADRVNVGDLVYVDATIQSRDDAISPDTLIQGWISMSPGAAKLHARYHNGSFAKEILVPLESVHRIPRSLVDKWGIRKLTWIQMLLVSYGQLKGGNILPGASVLITPATGFYSSLAVPVALAMAAGKVVVAGRTQSKLDFISAKFNSPRISTFTYTGNVEADAQSLSSQYPNLSLVVDLLPSGTNDTSTTLSALFALRTGGTLVLGGGAATLNVPYGAVLYKNLTIKGQVMYEKKWIPELISLVDAGLINLDLFEEQSFKLAKINEGVKAAQSYHGALKMTTLDLKE